MKYILISTTALRIIQFNIIINIPYLTSLMLVNACVYACFKIEYYSFSILQNKTKQNKTKQNKTKHKTKQNKTKQNKTKQNKTKQNKAKQNKTKQNKAKQKQNKTKTFVFIHGLMPLLPDGFLYNHVS